VFAEQAWQAENDRKWHETARIYDFSAFGSLAANTPSHLC
jgi:hypothetical protein